MARRRTSAQLRSRLQQATSKRRQAINRYNQAVRKYNRDLDRAIDGYNHAARTHNATVRAHRRRLESELTRLRSRPRQTGRFHSTLRVSCTTLHQAYLRLESSSGAHRPEWIEELAEQETANSLSAMNVLLGDSLDVNAWGTLQETTITDELRRVSQDLDRRWRGAIFSLNPGNPDAARHFCTSTREVFDQILESRAPTTSVLNVFPKCEKTDRGTPTRRWRIKFLLHQKQLTDEVTEDFVEKDIANILELFRVFNDGTHGSAGRFKLAELLTIKRRAEGGITFLSNIAC